MQYHYISDKELYHFGRSKKDGAKVGSGRYPLGSGNSRYERKLTNRVEQDWKDKKYKNTVTQYLKSEKNGISLIPIDGNEKTGSAANTLLDEHMKIRKSNKSSIISGLSLASLGGAATGIGLATGAVTAGIAPAVIAAVAATSTVGGRAIGNALKKRKYTKLSAVTTKHLGDDIFGQNAYKTNRVSYD